MKLKLFLLPIMAALLSVGLYSCSNDDDPITGKEQLERIKSLIYKNGKIVFTKIDNAENQYIVGATNAQMAKDYCNYLLSFKWNGKRYTYNLNDEMGSVVVAPGPQEGIFIRLIFDLEGIPTFTLDMASKAYHDNNNYRFMPPEGVPML